MATAKWVLASFKRFLQAQPHSTKLVQWLPHRFEWAVDGRSTPMTRQTGEFPFSPHSAIHPKIGATHTEFTVQMFENASMRQNILPPHQNFYERTLTIMPITRCGAKLTSPRGSLSLKRGRFRCLCFTPDAHEFQFA